MMDETVEHALFWCDYASSVRMTSGFWVLLLPFINFPVPESFGMLAHSVSPHQLEQFCMLTWAICSNRNCLIHQGRMHKPAELVDWSFTLLHEFKESYTSQQVSPSFPSTGSTSSSPSQQNTSHPGLTLRTDAAVKSGLDHCGVGAVICDSHDKIIATLSKSIRGCFSPETGEFLVLREGLLMAQHLRLQGLHVEVDASNVVTAVLEKDTWKNEVGCIVDDIRFLIEEVGVRQVQSIPRSKNDLAHNHASIALNV